jgi:hypothetical protein
MGGSFVIYTAEQAAEAAAIARANKRQQTIDEIAALEEKDGRLFDGLQVIFRKVEERFHGGSDHADFNLDKLFGKGNWRCLQQKLSDMLRDLGYKVEYSCSTSEYNETLYLSWKKPKD